MRSKALSSRLFAFLRWLPLLPFIASPLFAQANSVSTDAPAKVTASATSVSEPLIALHATSTVNLTSEIGGAFIPPVKCDAAGNLYIQKFAGNRPRGPVVKIDASGKATAVFDPAAFSQLALDRVDAFAMASDGGIYQIAKNGGIKPRIYALHYSSDGSPSSPTRLDADFEVYTFAAFPDGNFLVSGVQRDPLDKNDHGRGVSAVFSADGRELAKLTFQEPKQKARKKNAPAETAIAPERAPGAIDLKDAEAGRDGNLYVLRTSSQALIDVISPSGKIMKTLKIASPLPGGAPNSFHVSENRLALVFATGDDQSMAVVVVDAQTGRKIAGYSDSTNLGIFACYSANEGVFTFLKHADGNVIEVIRAEAQ